MESVYFDFGHSFEWSVDCLSGVPVPFSVGAFRMGTATLALPKQTRKDVDAR
jgi:hypothetical protein